MRYQHIQTILRGFIGLTGLLCGLLLVSLTSQVSQAAGATEKLSYLKLALSRPIASLAPYDKDCHQEIASQLFVGLTELASDTDILKAVPSLADRWEVSEDGTVYTFLLRQDAQWSNQEPLTAHDVEKTVRWYLDRGSSDIPDGLFILKNARKYADMELEDESLLGVRAIDEHTVRFTLEYPTPLFPVMTSLLHFRPLPIEHIQEADGNKWMHPEHILVSGPYMLKRWRKRTFLILEKNPAYFDAAKVQIPEIHYTMLPFSEVALKMYKRKQLDFMPFFKKKQWQEIKEHSDLRSNTEKRDKLETWYLGFNRSLPPFDQAPVREAVAGAIDKQLLLKKILGVIGETADSFTSPSGIGYVDPDDLQCKKNTFVARSSHLKRAKKLLKQAYPFKEEIPEIYIRGLSADADVVIPLLQEMLKKNLGISIQEKTDKAWRESGTAPHLFVTSKTAALPHAHYFLSEFYAADNRTAWTGQKHDEFKALLINALSHPSGSVQQKNIYQQAETMLCEELVLVPLFFRDIGFLAQAHLNWIPSKNSVQQVHLWSLQD